MQKPWMLLKTLEHMKASGLVDYFLDKTEGMYHNYWLDTVRSELELEKVGSPEGGESEDNDYHVGFSDSIISEGFFLFLYCITACGTYWLLRRIVYLLWSRRGRNKAIMLLASGWVRSCKQALRACSSKPLKSNPQDLINRDG